MPRDLIETSRAGLARKLCAGIHLNASSRNSTGQIEPWLDDYERTSRAARTAENSGTLEYLTLLIIYDLSFAGLPKIHNRFASQVLRFDLVTAYCVCHWPLPSR